MSARKPGTFRDPPTVNFDLLYHAARYTMLSPAFAIGLLLFTRTFQVCHVQKHSDTATFIC